MKRIEAIIQPHRLTKVTHALHELPRFPGLTLCDVQGQAHGRGTGGHHAFDDDCLTYAQKKMLVVVCEDSEADAIARLIADTAHTGNPGDGLVIVSDVSAVLLIRDAKGRTGGGA